MKYQEPRQTFRQTYSGGWMLLSERAGGRNRGGRRRFDYPIPCGNTRTIQRSSGHDLHVHAAVTEDEAQQITEDFESRAAFLLFSAACFQEVSHFAVGEEFLQGSRNFCLFILVDLCYACYSKSLPGRMYAGTYIIPYSAGFCLYFQCFQSFYAWFLQSFQGPVHIVHVGSLGFKISNQTAYGNERGMAFMKKM